jgi:hypothetical protein
MNMKEIMVRLDELYTKKNTDLRDYIKDESIPIDWDIMTQDCFCDWYDTLNSDEQYDLAELLDTPVDVLLEDPPSSSWFSFAGKYGKLFKECFGPHPDDIKTTDAIELESDSLLPRNTWLVHYTNHPDKIASQGFTKGIADMENLALTTHILDKHKENGGYSFAFLANSKYAANNFKSHSKYGDDMVFFQCSGVKTYHIGDNEQQIIFWGKDVPKNTICPVYKEDGDLIVKNWKTDREIFRTDSYVKMQEWIEKNYQQYKSTICSG